MGQALYRKYRSKKLSEIVGQEHVTKALQTALKDNHVSHAYLFTGPRGVGKTSIARIVAHEINGVAYADDSPHLDIIEIDAASNRRIDEIRDLRERVNIAPTSAKYKVYIIDEVHMLTKEAFNALLKTLEEPPAHVVFILATTEAHKLPETIISRTQRYSFRPVKPEAVIEHLRYIAEQEKIKVSNEALALIAAHGEGSMRDSISLLDQVRNSAEKVELQDVQATLGLAPDELISQLINEVEAGDSLGLVNSLTQMHDQGLEASVIAKQLGGVWRQQLLNQTSSLPPETVLNILEDLLKVSTSASPFALLEITLLKVASLSGPISPSKVSLSVVTSQEESQPVEKPKKEPSSKTKSSAATKLDLNIWSQVLEAIKKDHNTLYGVARMAQPRIDNNELILELEFPFHYKRLEEARNKAILLKTLEELTGQAVEFRCELLPPKPKSRAEDSSEQIKTISNIFGNVELLQSED